MSWRFCPLLPSWGLAVPWWDRMEEDGVIYRTPRVRGGHGDI